MIKIISFLFFILLCVIVINLYVFKKSKNVKNNDKNDINYKKIRINKPTDRVSHRKQIHNYAIANNSIVQKCFSKKELMTFNKYKKFSNRFIYKEGNIIKGEIWFTPSHYIE